MNYLTIFLTVAVITVEADKVLQLPLNTISKTVNVLIPLPQSDVGTERAFEVKVSNRNVQVDAQLETIYNEKSAMHEATPIKIYKNLRKTRAVPFVDDTQIPGKVTPKLTTDVNVIKAILAQRKRNMSNKPSIKISTQKVLV